MRVTGGVTTNSREYDFDESESSGGHFMPTHAEQQKHNLEGRRVREMPQLAQVSCPLCVIFL